MDGEPFNSRRSRSPPLASTSSSSSSTSSTPSTSTAPWSSSADREAAKAERARNAAAAPRVPASPETPLAITAVLVDEAGVEAAEEDDDDDDENVSRQHLTPTMYGPALPLRTEHSINNHPLKTSSSATAATAKATENDGAADQEGALLTADEPQRKRKSQSKNSFDDNESELSEPDSSVHSPLAVGLNDLEDEITFSAKTNAGQEPSPLLSASNSEDENMNDAQDQAPAPHYPKRKRTSTFSNLNESKLEAAPAGRTGSAISQGLKTKASRQSLGGVKGVLLGHWRDSLVPDLDKRHAVIGFIDVRDRLRTRIERTDLDGRPVSSEYPLPPGPGGSWVTFERITFSQHLVGLDHLQIKEYVRLRSDASEQSPEERRAAEVAAVNEAIRRAKENQVVDNATSQPIIAHGADSPEATPNPGRPDAKRRRIFRPFLMESDVNSDVPEPSSKTTTRPPLQPRPTTGLSVHDPLPGTRPTRILLGYWVGSSELTPEDRHAVYGILGQNDMFRVKVVKETRDGRFVGGNFPSGAGALWIQYEEVEFEPHLKPLSRSEVKEYCRVRQYQIDHGEVPEDRVGNETKAVSEAQARIGAGFKHPHQSVATHHTPAVTLFADDDAKLPDKKVKRRDSGLRQSKRKEGRESRDSRETRAQQRTPRVSLNEAEVRINRRAQNESDTRSSESRSSSRAQVDNLERASALARREIARAEAAQGRADRHAQHRERAAAMAADATATATAAAAAVASISLSAPATNGRARLHDSEEMQRLNKVWAKQEMLRMKAGSDDAKIYDGIKYERKTTGPFTGKLVSQGTIINIDGEDYVEYRVLTKPSFF